MNVANFYLFTPNQIAPATAMKLLADTTLAAPGNLDSGTFSDTSCSIITFVACLGDPSQANNIYLQVNGNTGNVYGYRIATDGNADSTNSNVTTIPLCETNSSAKALISGTLLNLSALDKLVHGQTSKANNDGVPKRSTWHGSIDIAGAVTSIQIIANVGTFAAGSRIIVMGC